MFYKIWAACFRGAVPSQAGGPAVESCDPLNRANRAMVDVMPRLDPGVWPNSGKITLSSTITEADKSFARRRYVMGKPPVHFKTRFRDWKGGEPRGQNPGR